MALKSKYSDVYIPDNLSWPHFVFQNFERYGDQTAVVREIQNVHTVRFLKNVYLVYISLYIYGWGWGQLDSSLLFNSVYLFFVCGRN